MDCYRREIKLEEDFRPLTKNKLKKIDVYLSNYGCHVHTNGKDEENALPLRIPSYFTTQKTYHIPEPCATVFFVQTEINDGEAYTGEFTIVGADSNSKAIDKFIEELYKEISV